MHGPWLVEVNTIFLAPLGMTAPSHIPHTTSNTRSLGGLRMTSKIVVVCKHRMTATGCVCKRPYKLNVILRPPKDLAVSPFEEGFANIEFQASGGSSTNTVCQQRRQMRCYEKNSTDQGFDLGCFGRLKSLTTSQSMTEISPEKTRNSIFASEIDEVWRLTSITRFRL